MATLPIPGLLAEFEILGLQAMDFGAQLSHFRARVLHWGDQLREEMTGKTDLCQLADHDQLGLPEIAPEGKGLVLLQPEQKNQKERDGQRFTYTVKNKFEPCLGTDHEDWSVRIIECLDSALHKALRACDQSLPHTVAELVDPRNRRHPSWQKYLLSSQLDMDRLDYLRRDSFFTGADYGHFDWYRLINSLELYDDDQSNRDIVWPEKACLAIEEFIFSRYYMYHNVYLHKTTRGFEKLLETMWSRAKGFFDRGKDALLVPAIRDFWSTSEPSVAQYLAIEEFTVLQQIQNWTMHDDKALNDLARRFLYRERLAMVDPPDFEGSLTPDYEGWGEALRQLVASRLEYDPPEVYCLVDRVKAKYYQPYFPEKEHDEQSVKNAIWVRVEGEARPIEISNRLTRLKPVTEAPAEKVRYYVPKDLQKDAQALRSHWK